MEFYFIYLHYQIHHNSLELKITLPIVALRKIHSHLLQLDERGILNQNRSSEEIYVQPVCFINHFNPVTFIQRLVDKRLKIKTQNVRKRKRKKMEININ